MEKMICIKTSGEEREQLKHDAHQHDMNVSEYVRWLIEKERNKMEVING